MRLLQSGVKPSISGDLWSDSGMGLFGIYAHGISESWVMEKALIGLVAYESERHTAANITKWTVDALDGIGLSWDELVGPDGNMIEDERAGPDENLIEDEPAGLGGK